MTDPKWYHTYTQDQWQKNYEAAMQALHKNHNDPEAMQALHESADALNAYDQEGVQQTKLGDIPNELGTVAHGLVDEAKGIPAGIGKVIHDARTGHLGDVGNDLYSGMKQMGSNILAPSDLALQELANGVQNHDPTVAPDEFNSGLRHGGAAMTDIAAVRAPGVIKKTAGSFNGAESGPSSMFDKLGKAAQFVPGPVGKIARGIKHVGELPSNISENYALKNALMKARLEQMGQNITKSGATMDDLIKQTGLKSKLMDTDLKQKSGSLSSRTIRPGLQNQLTELQIQKLQRMLDDMDNPPDEAGPSGSAPVSPKSPSGAPDILDPGAQAKADFKNLDPYGLNDLRNTKAPEGMKDNIMENLTKPTDLNDPLGKMINDLKEAETRGQAPHDILDQFDYDQNPGKPLTPEEINTLLGQINKKPPQGPNK